MCGRYTHLYTWRELRRLMTLTVPARDDEPGLEFAPSYNVAPTQLAPVVRQDGTGRHAAMLKWGLVPFWAKDPGVGSRMINARSEEAAGKPAFRDAVKKRRCLVPISGFYEWQAVPGSKTKQPWLIGVRDAELFALAGLWERWECDDIHLESFSILTCAPNELMATVHDRMPVIVPPERYDAWLNDPASLREIARPFPAERMEMRKVSTRVNKPFNNDPSVLNGPDQPALMGEP